MLVKGYTLLKFNHEKPTSCSKAQEVIIMAFNYVMVAASSRYSKSSAASIHT